MTTAPARPSLHPIPAGAAALAAGLAGAVMLAAASADGRSSAWSGPLVVAAVVLVLAGAAKAWRPAGAARALAAFGLPPSTSLVRALAVVEVAIGGAAAVEGGRVAGAAVAACYLAFAAAVGPLARADGSGCGCFGQDDDARPGPIHVVLNLCGAAAGSAAALASAGGAAAIVAAGGWSGVLATASALLASALVVAAYTVVPEVSAAAADRRAALSPRPFALTEEAAS